MKLYFAPGACSLSPHIALRESGAKFDLEQVDLREKKTKKGDNYLEINPKGQVPLLELDDGRVLTESNAMLCWLAEGTSHFGGDAWQRAQTLSWMFFEQYSHELFIAVARFICGWTPLDSPRRADLENLRTRGYQALAVMEKHLEASAWFSGTDYGIADIALFAYTHCAADGGFDLRAYPHVQAWLDRVRALPDFVPMPPYATENVALIEQTKAVQLG